MDTKVRKLTTFYRMHHPKEFIESFFASRENGQRGLIQLELANKTTIIGLKKYLHTSTDWS